jgi:hypothetical protein
MVNPQLVRDARLDLGRRLAALRQGAGHTQARLGLLVCQGRSSIAMAETGRQSMNHAFWVRCDTVLGTGGVLATQYLQIDALVSELRRGTQPADEPTTSVANTGGPLDAHARVSAGPTETADGPAPGLAQV